LDYNTNLSKKTWKLPVCFDGELDWDLVTKQSNLSKREYIERILTGEYTLAMLGFLPGFLYINGLATELHVARKSSPSKYVKAGSIAVGGPYIGIYDIDSPGGWNVIGIVPLKMANYRQLPIVPIHQSDKLVFEQISKKQYEEIFALQINLDQYNG